MSAAADPPPAAGHSSYKCPQCGAPQALQPGTDALVCAQEVGHLVHAGTVGGAQTDPDPSAIEALGRCPGWLVATDFDGSGSQAAWRWREIDPARARRACLPIGKDLAEFHQLGESVLDWLRGELARLGWAAS